MTSISRIYLDGQAAVVSLLSSLDDSEWATPVPCTPLWTVRDVLSQELPGPGRLFTNGRFSDRIRVYAMFDNFLNLLDSSWNIQRRRQFAGLQEIANISGVDAQGRYIISGATPLAVDTNCADDNPNNPTCGTSAFDRANFINVSGSVWRIKLGISYEF